MAGRDFGRIIDRRSAKWHARQAAYSPGQMREEVYDLAGFNVHHADQLAIPRVGWGRPF